MLIPDNCSPITDKDLELSIVLPCLNEALTLGTCIQKAQAAMLKHGIEGEVIVADNGSEDGSQAIAQSLGAKVVNVVEKGYGSALQAGIEAAKGTYVLMGDADDSYNFLNIYPFVEKLREGYDLVMGNRFKGGVEPKAMPFLHKYLGNPVLSFVGRLFFGNNIGDFHCGMRAFRKDAYEKMQLQTLGMEFATEMIVKATFQQLSITEVPIKLYPDGRNRPPHLRTWRDGWRHLRFMCLYAPAWTFLYPGLLLMCIGLILALLIWIQPLVLGGIRLEITTLLYACLMILVGFQAVLFYLKAKIFAMENDLLPKSTSFYQLFDYFTLERGLIVGFLSLLTGIGFALMSIREWSLHNFGDLQPFPIFRYSIPAFMGILMGCQLIFSSIFFSILGLKKKK